MKKLLEFIMKSVVGIMIIGIHVFVGVLIYDVVININLQGFSETIGEFGASIIIGLMLLGIDSLILYDYLDY